MCDSCTQNEVDSNEPPYRDWAVTYKVLIAVGENSLDIKVSMSWTHELQRNGVMLSKTGGCRIVRLNDIRMEMDSSVTESLLLVERKLWIRLLTWQKDVSWRLAPSFTLVVWEKRRHAYWTEIKVSETKIYIVMIWLSGVCFVFVCVL